MDSSINTGSSSVRYLDLSKTSITVLKNDSKKYSVILTGPIKQTDTVIDQANVIDNNVINKFNDIFRIIQDRVTLTNYFTNHLSYTVQLMLIIFFFYFFLILLQFFCDGNYMKNIDKEPVSSIKLLIANGTRFTYDTYTAQGKQTDYLKLQNPFPIKVAESTIIVIGSDPYELVVKWKDESEYQLSLLNKMNRIFKITLPSGTSVITDSNITMILKNDLDVEFGWMKVIIPMGTKLHKLDDSHRHRIAKLMLADKCYGYVFGPLSVKLVP